jgi:type I restriction enzyme R subunit
LIKNGYPPVYSGEVFNKVMEQVENFEENSDYSFSDDKTTNSNKDYQPCQENISLVAAEETAKYEP